MGQGQVYTLHVNMPNLTSASGSWILNFAEMDTGGAARAAFRWGPIWWARSRCAKWTRAIRRTFATKKSRAS